MTNLEVVSRIIGSLNSLHKDSRISKRYILNVARKKAEFLLSQKLNDRSLFKEDSIFKELNCFELEQISVISCPIIEFRRCKSIMRSKCKLPSLIYSRYGGSLKEVLSIDGETEFKATTPAQYRRDKDRAPSDYSYYYIKDGYLYLIDSEVHMVNLYVLTLETEKLDEISACNSNTDKLCTSLWEHEFIISTKIAEAVISETLKEVSMRLQINADENPNLNSNEK